MPAIDIMIIRIRESLLDYHYRFDGSTFLFVGVCGSTTSDLGNINRTTAQGLMSDLDQVYPFNDTPSNMGSLSDLKNKIVNYIVRSHAANTTPRYTSSDVEII